MAAIQEDLRALEKAGYYFVYKDKQVVYEHRGDKKPTEVELELLGTFKQIEERKQKLKNYLRRQVKPWTDYSYRELSIDVEQDRELWEKVLRAAWQQEWTIRADNDTEALKGSLHGLLHGLRCEWVRLEIEEGKLRLKRPEIMAQTEWQNIIQEYLMPQKTEIKNLFEKIEKKLTPV